RSHGGGQPALPGRGGPGRGAGAALRRPLAVSNIRLRPARPDDLDLLRRWDEEPHVVASDPNDDWGWETELARNPDWRKQLIAELDGRPIGFIEIIDPAREEGHYWGDIEPDLRALDIWIGEPDCLGRGYGTEMMRQALARCFRSEERREGKTGDYGCRRTRARKCETRQHRK